MTGSISQTPLGPVSPLPERLRIRARARRDGAHAPTMRMIAGVCGLLVLLLGGRAANAYPQFQLSSGSARCSDCHFGPAGGGLLTQFGRDFMADEQASFGGNGDFLHGAVHLPRWLAMSGELRGAYVAHDAQDPSGTQQAVFPMQADVEVRATAGDFSLYATGGFRAQVRRNSELVPDQNYQPISTSTLISREHYLMWRPGALGPYLRAGRFFAPFGLRLAEHVLYVRRDLGFNQLEESYNLSFGYVSSFGEIHATLFAPDFVRHIGGDTSGLAIYGEGRLLDDSVAFGLQAKLELGGDSHRTIVGVVGKKFISGWRSLLFTELDGIRLDTDGGNSNQFVGLAGGSVFPVKGVMLTVVGERRQTDLRVRDTATDATALFINWVPYAHLELQSMGRLQFPAGADATKTFLAQVHYVF
jgi:hypothetical protein